MRLTRPLWLLVACLLAAIGLSAQQPNTMNNGSASSSPAASPKVPRLVKFSGMLRDLTGKPLTGPVDVNFAIYREEADLVPIWYEAQTLQLDEQGRYTVLLGAMQAEGLPMALFTSGEARWLEVYVPGAEPQPRTLLVSVPYALKAGDSETLGGKPASAFMLVSAESGVAQSVTTAVVGDTGLRASTLERTTDGTTAPQLTSGTTGYIAKFTSTTDLGNSAVFESGGNVGIGTTSPNANEPYNRLTVAGNDDTALAMGIENAGAGHSGLVIRRTGGAASRWLEYMPYGSTDLRFFNGGDLVTFQAGGSVGIGTTSPNANEPYSRLTVAGNDDTALAMGVENAGIGHSGLVIRRTGGAASRWLEYMPYGSTDLRFFDDGDVVTFQAGGNVGIGTTAPGEKLEVAGNVKASGSVTATSFSGNGAGLTNVVAATASDLDCAACVAASEVSFNYANSASQGGAATSALTAAEATNALSLGGVTAGNYARLDVGNDFSGNQSVVSGAEGTPALSAQATGLTSDNAGLYGTANSSDGAGVIGEANNGSVAVGVWGLSSTGYAGLFSGNVNVSGVLSASTKNFKIDHPLDPANKYLFHASVESSELKTIYDGTVTLDAGGEAVVQLPEWFEALNEHFRYQLTCVGDYAPVYIAQKIRNHSFRIAGGKPGLEVSWQVTGIRHDAFATAHPLVVEVDKPERERGYFLHPELHGAGKERSIEWAHHPGRMRRMSGRQLERE